MRVPGRITLFGEAFAGLRDQATASVPTREAVLTDGDAGTFAGTSTYLRAKDGVGRALLEIGAIERLEPTLYSDLPLGYGLASSTALALAHLGRLRGPEVEDAVTYVDGRINGFRPSGADYAAVSRNESGIFGLAGWRQVDIRLPQGSHLVLPPTDSLCDKKTPTLAMQRAAAVLGPLIGRLVRSLDSSGEIDWDDLLTYSRHLLHIGVYSETQRAVIEPLLARGIIAKGVGAMYDRAILVLADPRVWNCPVKRAVLRQVE